MSSLSRVLSPKSSRRVAAALLSVGLLLGSECTMAQTFHATPARLKAENRRALRDARSTETPYKDSHLGVTSARLKRGNSPQGPPEGSEALRYKKNTAVKVKPPGLLDNLRRRKKQ